MKTPYFSKNLKKASILGALLLCAMFVSAAEVLVETTVFKDTFNRGTTELNGEKSPTTYTIVKQFISGTEAGDPTPSSQTFGDVLRIPAPATSVGRTGLFGNLSDFVSPFTTKLSEMEVDSIAWMFNIRDNRGTPAGLDDTQFGTAVILLSDAANYASANGYAIVGYGSNLSARKYRLAKFTNGLDGTAKFTTIAEVFSSLNTTTYVSLRVVFVISSNTWKLYGRIDGPASGGSFTDPTTGSFTEFQSGVDNTFTSSTMTNFGFMCKYNSYSTAYNMFIDNYTVKTYHMDVLQSNKALQANTGLFKTRMLPGAVEIETASATATLYDVTGKVQHTVAIDGKGTIKVQNQGLYLLKVALTDGRSGVEKIFIP